MTTYIGMMKDNEEKKPEIVIIGDEGKVTLPNVNTGMASPVVKRNPLEPEPIPLVDSYMDSQPIIPAAHFNQYPFKKRGTHLTPPKKKRKKNVNRRN